MSIEDKSKNEGES